MSREFYYYGLKMSSSLIGEDEECIVQTFIDKRVPGVLNTKLDDDYINTMRKDIRNQMKFRKYTDGFNNRGVQTFIDKKIRGRDDIRNLTKSTDNSSGGPSPGLNVAMIIGLSLGVLLVLIIGSKSF